MKTHNAKRFRTECARPRPQQQPHPTQGRNAPLLACDGSLRRPGTGAFRLLVATLLAALNLFPAARGMAQTFTTLHRFNANDGANPGAGLILSGNTLYGTAVGGGASGNGTIFAVNTDGTGFTNLHSFTALLSPSATNSDGSHPYAALMLSENTLYGTASQGGSSGDGTVFALNTDGTGFINLHNFTVNFTVNEGAWPQAALVFSGSILYGTAEVGGPLGSGTVFAVNTNGTGFTNLSFAVDHPFAGLILSGNTLYGTSHSGGSGGIGSVFAVNIDGTGFTNLHSFAGSDGANPHAGLILSADILYGTATHGGTWNSGTVFTLKTDGTGFTNLHDFTATSGVYSTNSDGAYPSAGVIL